MPSPQPQTQQYTRDQLWKLYDKLPAELQAAVFSADNAAQLESICQRYAIEELKIPGIAKLIGRVFLGVLSPEDFSATFEKEIDLKKETSKQVLHEINRFILAPVRNSLDQIYHSQGATAAENPKTPAAAGLPEKTETPQTVKETAPTQKEKVEDVYRETIK